MFEVLVIFRTFTYGFFAGLMVPHIKARPLQHWNMTATKKEQ